jgi:Flp pilus assembly pilin Flp
MSTVGLFLFLAEGVTLEQVNKPNRRGDREMNRVIRLVVKWQIWKDRKGQDLIEYALMAGFVAVAAGAIMPGVASSINIVFSKVNSIMVEAAAS